MRTCEFVGGCKKPKRNSNKNTLYCIEHTEHLCKKRKKKWREMHKDYHKNYLRQWRKKLKEMESVW